MRNHISNDKQEDASEAPDMDGKNEDSTDVVLGSNCKQALSNDDRDIFWSCRNCPSYPQWRLVFLLPRVRH